MTLKRYLIPAFFCVNDESLEAAVAAAEEDASAYNSAADERKLWLCGQSPTVVLSEADEDGDLEEDDPPAIPAEARIDNARLQTALRLLSQARDALQELVSECNTNGDFATLHQSEERALQKAERVEWAILDSNVLEGSPTRPLTPTVVIEIADGKLAGHHADSEVQLLVVNYDAGADGCDPADNPSDYGFASVTTIGGDTRVADIETVKLDAEGGAFCTHVVSLA